MTLLTLITYYIYKVWVCLLHGCLCGQTGWSWREMEGETMLETDE